MALVRWDPFSELNSLHESMNSLFNEAFGQRATQLAPVTDVYSQNDNEMVVEVHLPSFKEEEINVDVQDSALVISAEHSERTEDNGDRRYLVRESSSSFYRRVALPKQADAEHIKADFRSGVLRVVVPFKELPKPQRVKIVSGEKSEKNDKKKK